MKNFIIGAALFALSSTAFAQQSPTTVNAVSTANGVAISWNATADNYRVYRELRNDDNTFNNAVEIGSGLIDTSFNDASAISGTTYKYFVAGCNADQQCAQLSLGAVIVASTVVVNAPTTDTGFMCPAISGSTANDIPTNVSINLTDSPVLLTWVPPEGSVRWNVYRNNVYEFTTTNGVPAYEVENHLDGNTYYVTAIFADGSFSPRSDDATENANAATPIDAPPIVDCSLIQAENEILNEQLEASQAELQTLQAEFDELILIAQDLATENENLLTTNVGLLGAVEQAETDRDAALAGSTSCEALLVTAETDLAACVVQLP